MDDDDHDSQGTEVRRGDAKDKPREERQELAAQDAFVAGMMYALGQRLLPGAPYTPSAASYKYGIEYNGELDRGRWKLEDCLRYVLPSFFSYQIGDIPIRL
jgi:ketohexokinase